MTKVPTSGAGQLAVTAAKTGSAQLGQKQGQTYVKQALHVS